MAHEPWTLQRPADLAVSFNDFWNVYPRRVGKKAAQKAWDKLKPSAALVERIIASVEAHLDWPEWMKDGGAFIPHPATFINQGRWDDEPTTARRALISDVSRQNVENGKLAAKLMREGYAAKR
jgi:hypothetical protein